LWLLGWDVQLTGKYQHFPEIGMFLDFTDPENGGSKLLENIGTSVSIDTLSYPRRPESSTTLV
jgi:hypothetical protein